jgi:hypothetical protein
MSWPSSRNLSCYAPRKKEKKGEDMKNWREKSKEGNAIEKSAKKRGKKTKRASHTH